MPPSPPTIHISIYNLMHDFFFSFLFVLFRPVFYRFRFHLRRIRVTVDNDDLANIKYNLTIVNVEETDAGNYTCEQLASVDIDTKPIKKLFRVQTVVLPRIVNQSPKALRTKISQSVQLYCVIEAHPVGEYLNLIKWTKDDDDSYRHQHHQHQQQPSATPKAQATPSLPNKDDRTSITNRTRIVQLDQRRINITLDVIDISKKDNGSYSCVVDSPYDRAATASLENGGRAAGTSAILVLDVPQVSLDFVKAVGANQIFLNWTTNDGNAPVKQYFVQFMKEGATTFTYYNHAIDGKNLSYVLSNFDPKTNYKLKITAQNALGMGPTYTHSQWVRTLETDPVFVPEIGVKGNTHSTITIGWHPPPAHLLEYIQYYELVVSASGDNASIIEEAIHPQNSRNLPYMFDNVSLQFGYFNSKC